ncbi:S49 family peptidase [Azohydromonas aeria]|uniref:S49 family peptidase n=1 Tax=Azohydromonas aeria TaxID=2590212 RepID=UPI0012F8A8FF|nr:S49 family peptidase [Azohydromonas aeria]
MTSDRSSDHGSGHEKGPVDDSAGSHERDHFRLILELVREMRSQRQSFETAQNLAVSERRSERRWKMMFQALVFGVPVLLGILYFLFFLSTTGFQWGPFGKAVGVVRIEGPIAAGERASADKIVPLLEKAFSNASVEAVVLSIDSPGGAPVESERIYTAIGFYKKQYPKPVIAVVNNLGASAAYLIALHADRIVAGKYSLVGSIGAVIAPWQLDKAIAKFDVSQRVYASGKLKAFLNPFTPVSPEVDAKAQMLVDQTAAVFVNEVKSRRSSKLKAGVNIATGEVWPGPEALVVGLVDEIGTLDEFVRTNFKSNVYDFGPNTSSTGFLGRAVQDAVVSVLEGVALRSGELQLR